MAESNRRTGQGPTQLDRVLTMLLDDGEVCGSTFFEAYLPRFSVQIHLLRRDGWVISKRPCDIDRHHHHGTSWLYRIESVPDNTGQLAMVLDGGGGR